MNVGPPAKLLGRAHAQSDHSPGHWLRPARGQCLLQGVHVPEPPTDPLPSAVPSTERILGQLLPRLDDLQCCEHQPREFAMWISTWPDQPRTERCRLITTLADPAQAAAGALLRLLAGASLLVGLLAAPRGVAVDLYAATRAPGPVPVSVRIRNLDRLQIQQATSHGSETVLSLRLQQGLVTPGLHLYIRGVDHNDWLQAGTDPVILRSVGSTVAEQLVDHGGGAIVGLCVGWGALLVRKLLLSIGRGQPFQRGNAARIAGIAALILVATLAGGMLPYLAARLVLDRLGLGGAGSPLYAQLAIPFAPFLLALFLLAFAQAFQRGTELARDTEGLV